MPHIHTKPILTFGELITEEEKMTDTFRKEYRPLSEQQKELIELIKDRAESLLSAFNEYVNFEIAVDARQMALAKTNLEQAIMWAVKAIT